MEHKQQGALARIVEHPRFQSITTTVILLNAVTLGLETSPTVMAHIGGLLGILDKLALVYFTVEVGLRVSVQRLRYFRSGWNLFDFAIVGISLLPHSGGLSVLRALRILRALRLFSTVPSLKRVVNALTAAMPGMASIAVVLAVLFYVSAVLSTKLFGTDFPDLFGHLGHSLYTLFQIMTLEGWSDGIVRPVMALHWWAWIFFLPFIVVTSFAVLNLFIGVIVSAIQEVAEPSKTESDMEADLKALRRDMDELLRRLPDRSTPTE
ncbi:MAG: hypothetical protein RL173_3057 [Fibrobacterota bacterium]|jgi:voltage-gated sodium channel